MPGSPSRRADGAPGVGRRAAGARAAHGRRAGHRRGRVRRLPPRRPADRRGPRRSTSSTTCRPGRSPTSPTARAEAARLDVGELHIHTLDACSDDLATLIAMRRPSEVFHLALVTRHGASAVALGPLVHVDARRARRRPPVRRHQGRRRRCRPRPCTATPPGASCRSRRARCRRAACAASSPRRSSTCSAPTARTGASSSRRSPSATVYGPRQRPDGGVRRRLVAAAADGRPPRITGDGRQTRDFVYVDDVVDALVRPGSGAAGWSSTSAPASRRRSASCGRWSPRRPRRRRASPARPDEVLRFAVSPVRARIHLAWSPWTSLDEGLAALR